MSSYRVIIAIVFVFSVIRPCHGQSDSLSRLDILCGNDQPLPSEFDSLYGPYPELVEKATRAVLSPDERLIAFNYEKMRDIPMSGVQIYDLLRRRKGTFIPGQIDSQWHPFENKLLTAHYVYNLDTDELIDLPILVNGRSYWSPNGKYIYYRTGQTVLVRTTADGQNMEYIPHLHTNYIPISDSLFFSFNENGIEISDIAGRNKWIIELQWMKGILFTSNITISPDGRYVLADFREKGYSRWNRKQFLGMIDLQTYMLRKVLPSQYLGNMYYPSWTTRGTILVSYVCRNDSVYGIWEIDTNGVFLRQLIGKEDLKLLTTVEQIPQRPSNYSITSFFPQPGDRQGILEYVVAKAGSYSMSIIALSGKELRCVFHESWFEPGRHRSTVRTDDLPPGMYLFMLTNKREVPVYRSIVITR